MAHAQPIHRYAFRVYYEDTDAGGVVYHANYLRYAERARTEALREAGIPHADLVERFNLMFMVRRAEIDYVRPGRLDDTLVVETEAVDIRGASVVLRQTVRGLDGVRALVRVKLVCVRTRDSSVARIPPQWREAMAAMTHGQAPGPTPGRVPRSGPAGLPGDVTGRDDMDQTTRGGI